MIAIILKRKIVGISISFVLLILGSMFYSQLKIRAMAEEKEVVSNEKQVRVRELYEQARLKGASGEYIEAITGLDKLIEFEPSYAEAYILRGHAKYLNGDKEEALEDYRLAAIVYKSNGELDKVSVPLKAIEMHYDSVEIKREQSKAEAE